jgi:hypothetical protein
VTRDFWTEDRLHIRTDRADWARYQATKSGEGFRMPHMPKRKWRRTSPVAAAPAAPVDPVAELRAEMQAGFRDLKMESQKLMRSVLTAAATIVAVVILAASATLIILEHGL